MATFRVGVGSFNIQDGAVGFGTDTDGLGNLRVKGVTKTKGSIVSGASTLTRYSGFAADNINQLENITLTSEVGTIGDIVVGVGTSVIISSGSTVTVGTVESVSIGTHFSPPIGGIEERGQDFVEGMMRFNTDLNTLEFYDGHEWRQFNYQSDVQNSPGSRGRGVFGGKSGAGTLQFAVDKIQIASGGTTTDWGNMRCGRYVGQNCVGGDTRVIFAGGYGLSPSPETSDLNAMDYGNFASGGEAVDFGNLTDARRGAGTCSSSTRGILWGGQAAPALIIDYWQIHTLGDALVFADLGGTAYQGMFCFSSATRGIRTSDENSDSTDMAFITFASTGQSSEFGDYISSTYLSGTASNGVRGIIAGGYNPHLGSYEDKQIGYVTIASTGSATNFGELSATGGTTGVANHTRGVFGRFNPSTNIHVIDSVHFSTTGDAVDFGEMSGDHSASGIAASDSHGGLGGY